MRVILALFLFSFLLVSCSEKNHTRVATAQKPTYFEKKYDCEFSFSGSQIGELHGAYAITNNLALSLTGAWGADGPSAKHAQWNERLLKHAIEFGIRPVLCNQR
jgi:hypothetical protein